MGKSSSESGATTKATGSRGDTQILVEKATLELLEEEGVLGGLNLQDVAKRAGVNRGLLYHYFSTKRELLRSAIRHRMASGGDTERTPDEVMNLGDRVALGLRRGLQYEHILRLTTLLHLDGSTAPKLMPNAKSTLVILDRDRLSGEIPDDADLPALHAIYAAFTFGHVLFHEILARDLGIDVAELDERVAREAKRVFGNYTETTSSSAEQTEKLKEP